MVIRGASGALTKRKLIPALCNLAQSGLLSPRFAIIGFAFDDWDGAVPRGIDGADQGIRVDFQSM